MALCRSNSGNRRPLYQHSIELRHLPQAHSDYRFAVNRSRLHLIWNWPGSAPDMRKQRPFCGRHRLTGSRRSRPARWSIPRNASVEACPAAGHRMVAGERGRQDQRRRMGADDAHNQRGAAGKGPERAPQQRHDVWSPTRTRRKEKMSGSLRNRQLDLITPDDLNSAVICPRPIEGIRCGYYIEAVRPLCGGWLRTKECQHGSPRYASLYENSA